ncbi:hypothetical protein H8E77_08260 [bacterium]|nr:hypothetical protein [bacterium]
MLRIKAGFKAKWWIGILIVSLLLGLSYTISAQERGLGDIPLDEWTYQRYLKILAIKALPESYDARDDGIVTPPKDQGACGSCWSFASVGAFESHLLKEFAVEPKDLSEQQQVSCNLSMGGCCGGNMTALRWWETCGAIEEACFPYGESSTSCPTKRTVPCEDSSECQQLLYRVTNYHTINTALSTQVKTSLYNDGPSYFRFDVYSDFSNFWHSGSPGEVYVNGPDTTERGGHAILIIGWDDDKEAYLFKNSWGTGGPNGDGTFWMAYSGHAHNLNFQMANFDLSLWSEAYRLLFKNLSELELFRRYRDELLVKSDQGKQYTDSLYKYSEEALSVLLNNPHLMRKAQSLIEANKDAVSEVLDGNAGVIHNTDEIISFLAAYARKSPPALKVLAHMVRKEMLKKQKQDELFLGFRLE